MSDVPASAPRGAARVAIVGSGPLADEVARNLALAGIPVAMHGTADFWTSLRLADLQDCYCAVAAGADAQARRRLNRLCQVASVDFVSVALVGPGLVVESFPFGSDLGCACLCCEAPLDDAGEAAPAPDPIAASIAGALAAATALQCANHGARRLSLAEPTDAGAAVALRRRPGCPDCAPPWRAPRVIRTRNRWLAREPFARDAAALAGQLVQLSDPLVTAWVCANCGRLPAAAAQDAAPAACPGCGGSLRIEAADSFTLGELMDRIGAGTLPVKFAVADIGGTSVCFDLETGHASGPSTRG